MKGAFRRIGTVLALVAVTMLVYGCPPDAEMKRAESAIKDAKKAGAAEYAADELASAEKALSEGKTYVGKFSYKKAKQKFEEAYRLALAARDKALAAQKPGPTEPVTTNTPTYTPPPSSKQTHTVVKGDCLWWIAEDESTYGDPFQWPLIYWENQDEIDSTAHKYGHTEKEEDWIYPGQEFTIPPNSDQDKVKDARKKAGAPAPYTPDGK